MVPGAIRMVLAHPADAKTFGAVLIHLQVVGRTHWRGFVLVPQLLFSLMIELLIPAFRFSSLLPEFICPVDDLVFGGILHLVSSER